MQVVGRTPLILWKKCKVCASGSAHQSPDSGLRAHCTFGEDFTKSFFACIFSLNAQLGPKLERSTEHMRFFKLILRRI